MIVMGQNNLSGHGCMSKIFVRYHALYDISRSCDYYIFIAFNNVVRPLKRDQGSPKVGDARKTSKRLQLGTTYTWCAD